MKSAKNEPASFVYFIQAEHGGPVKIGHTRRPRQRVAALQAASPVRLVVRRLEQGTDRHELWLHSFFANYRLHGEWFTPHPVLAALANAIPDANLEGDVFRPAGWSQVYAIPPWIPDADTFIRTARSAAEQHTADTYALMRAPSNLDVTPYRTADTLTAYPDDMAPEETWSHTSATFA